MRSALNHLPGNSARSAKQLLTKCLGAWAGLGAVIFCCGNLLAAQSSTGEVTSLAELQDRFATNRRAMVSFRLEAVVCAVQKERGLLALQDDSATVLLELPLPAQELRPGMWVAVDGKDCVVSRSSFGIHVGTGPVAEMDGLHSARGDSGSVYLPAGRQPLRVEWFNGVRQAALQVDYEGPGVDRQPIPAGLLTHRTAKGSASWDIQTGLYFNAYEGEGWTDLPDFRKLQPTASGVTPNFDIERRTRAEGAALVFNGFLQVSNAGLYTFHLLSDDGGRIFAGDPADTVQVTALDRPVRLPVAGRLAEVLAGRSNQQWISVEGRVGFAFYHGGHAELEVMSQGRSVSVMIVDGSDLTHTNLVNQWVRLTGVCQSFHHAGQGQTPRLIVAGAEQLECLGAIRPRQQAEVLTTAAQIRSLQPDEARRPMEVKVRGVVTWATFYACVLQDFSGGVFAWYSAGEWGKQPRPGELWEFEGVTDPGDFSPLITVSNATCLGNTPLPEPISPTWEELMNGSLDADLVEIEGVILAVSPEEMTLLTRGGQVKILSKEFYPLPGASESGNPELSLRGSVVRIRGVLAAEWDRATGRVKPGRFYLGNAKLSTEAAALGDPFSISTMRAADLLLFTSHIGSLTRVKLAGQVLHAGPRNLILVDGGIGFRVMVNELQPVQEGDVVEVVGFPQLGGPSPVLLEARVRKTGSQSRPEPKILSPDELSDRGHDATLVRVEAMLLSDTVRHNERVLELHTGENHFFARLPLEDPSGSVLRRGSQLQLTGVYSCVRQEDAGNSFDAFDLLLNRPTDIVVLRKGPWWTVRHTFVTLVVLLAGLAAAAVWITQLRRTVTQRTAQLRREIDERQQIEQRRAVEQERARIAQDLHDDLGAGLAHIGLIGALAQRHSGAAQRVHGHLTEITDKSREMVAALDEIVWATNPKHDSATSVSSYLCAYAEEFLRSTNVASRFDVTSAPATHFSTSWQRHQLLLAFKEALSNVVKHAGASEVWIRVRVEEDALCVIVEDNGKGITSDAPGSNSDGLQNMRERLNQIGGRCEIENRDMGGTVVRFHLPTSVKTSG